jgi:hypothetical protein
MARKKNLKTAQAQDEAVVLLVSGIPPIEVARRVGVADRTLRLWREDEEFCTALDKARAEVRDRSFDAVVALGEEAIAGLRNAIAHAVATLHDPEIGGFNGEAASFLLRVADSAVLRRLPTANDSNPNQGEGRVVIMLPENGRDPARLAKSETP